MAENSKIKSKKKTASKKSAFKSNNVSHPDHSAHLVSLRRIKGQVAGIEKMITAGRYCPDIINQVKAASAALKSIEAEILKSHVRACVKAAFNSGEPFEAETKIREIVKMMY